MNKVDVGSYVFLRNCFRIVGKHPKPSKVIVNHGCKFVCLWGPTWDPNRSVCDPNEHFGAPMSLRPFWNGGPCNPEGRPHSLIARTKNRSTKDLSKAVLKTANETAGSALRPLVGGPYCSLEAPS